MVSFAELGMDSGIAPRNIDENARARSRASKKDHFVERDGIQFAGTHLIIDLWGAQRLDDIEHIHETLCEAVEAAGATLVHIHLHPFSTNGGVSGVAVLAESHISIHTWPEHSFAALDVFMCGQAEPRNVVSVFERAFAPESVDVQEYLRGRAT